MIVLFINILCLFHDSRPSLCTDARSPTRRCPPPLSSISSCTPNKSDLHVHSSVDTATGEPAL
jgi:hypothetical protein